MNSDPKNTRLGILGDGQLSRMLADSARKSQLKVQIFSNDPQSPAAKLGLPMIWGESSCLGDLRNLISKSDVVVFENEFVDVQLLSQAAEGLKTQFVPSLENIKLFQNKLNQKQKLIELKIPTSPYLEWDGHGSIEWIKKAFTEFGEVVFKWARLGYDGKGVFISSDFNHDLTGIIGFIEEAKKKGIEVFAEKKINFRRELALVSCWSVNSEFAAYPLVISRQERGICREVMGPAVSLGVASALEEKAREYARHLASSCHLFGTFAIEFFETDTGELVVNEIAPRVHNSGHFTMDASETSQFENHWRAVLGLPLGNTTSMPYFAMWNILGPDDVEPMKDSPQRRPKVEPPLILHWYEKSEIRSRRKLGHINAASGSSESLSEMINEIRRADREWTLSLKMS